MKFLDFINDLNSSDNANETLGILYAIIVDRNTSFIKKIVELISTPSAIENTNKFASLLVDLNFEEFIYPLAETIQTATYNQTTWLADYLYALDALLEKEEHQIVFEEEFIHLLGSWLTNTGGGEIAWKSACILSNIKHPACYQYYLKSVNDKNLFFLTRNACLRGLVNQYGLKEIALYKELLNDESSEIRKSAQSAIEWLNK